MPKIVKVDITGLQHDITCGWPYGVCRLCDIITHSK